MKNQPINYFIDMDLTISTINIVFEKKYSSHWRYEEKNGRSAHGLAFVLDGKAVHHIAEGTFPIKKNDIVYLPKGSKYLTIGDETDLYHIIVVSFQVNNNLEVPHLPLSTITKVDNSAFYANLFHQLENTWFYKGVAYKLKCKSILQEILFHLIKHSVEENLHIHNVSKILPAVEYMDAYFDKNIDIKQLSEMVNLSVSHFRRLFKQVYRISPIEYLTSLRINKAKDLIMSDMYTIREIAERVGYTNIYYFSRAFRRETGECPTDFKKG